MEETTAGPFTAYVPVRGAHLDFHEVSDELYLDLGDGTGTQHLAGTCYGVAVTDCLWLGAHRYILKVRPALRSRLYDELREKYQVYKLHCGPGPDEARTILTANLSVKFAPEASRERRRAALRPFFDDLPDTLEDGVYTLPARRGADALVAWKRLELEPEVREACPISIQIDSKSVRPANVDLIGAETS